MGAMSTGCRYEFQVQHFGFNDCPASKFYTFQWSKSRPAYVTYRFCTFAFQLGWLIAGWTQVSNNYHLKLSNWCMTYSAIYYTFAWLTAVYGLVSGRLRRTPPPSPLTYANAAADLMDSVTTMKEGKEGRAENKVSEEASGESEKFQWFHGITWIFHTIALDTVVIVTVIYWAAVFPGEDPDARNIHGYAKHAINFTLLLVDCALVNTPIRLLHAVYMVAASLVYTAVLGIAFAVGSRDRIYGFLDFENSLGRTLAILLSISVLLSWLLQVTWFGVYHLRWALYRKRCGKHDRFQELGPQEGGIIEG